MTAPAVTTIDPAPNQRASFLVDQDVQMQRSRAFYDGTDAVLAGRTLYNPQGSREDSTDYESRLSMSVVDGAYWAVVQTAIGLPFAKEPQLSTDTPDAIADLWENIDGRGTHGVVYWQERMLDAVLDGFALSVDDYTPVQADNARDEAAQGARPYSVAYRKRDLLGVRTATVGGVVTLVQVVLSESYTVAVGEFGQETRSQVRRIWRELETGEVRWQVWRSEVEGAEWRMWREGYMRGKGGAKLNRFPVRVLYGDRPSAPFVARPAFIEVCDLARAHYQTWSDRRWGIRLGCNPIPVFTGVTPESLAAETKAGPSRGIVLAPADARFGFVAAPSDMMQPALDELHQIEGRIAAISFAHIAGTPRSNETAAAKRLDTAATDSTLAAIVRRLADCVDESLAVMAEYLGVPEGTIGIDRDFRAPVLLESGMLSVLSVMVDRRQLTLETLLIVLKTGRFPDNWNLDDEALAALAGAEEPLDEVSPYRDERSPLLRAGQAADPITDATAGGA